MTASIGADESAGVVRVGADIGGTFTDVAAVDGAGVLHLGKRLTTHGAEHEGVLAGVGDTGVALDGPGTILAHGTTLVINALLERKGARVAFVTTKGFGDLLEVGRGNRTENFTLRFRRPPPLVPPELCFEVDERTYGDRTIGRTPTPEELDELASALEAADVESIAVGFLHSYAVPDNERSVAEHLRRALPDVPVIESSSLSRQWREFERFSTAVANGYVAPVAERYLRGLTDGFAGAGFDGRFLVLDSSGGAMSVTTATRYPVRAVESGPVAGVIAARALAERMGIANLVTLDVGGTTAKSALVEHAAFATKDLYWIGGSKQGFPLQVSTVDIIEVGVGGGSIAWLDGSGRLQVGPVSAGSSPGPACYGRGGTAATLTDANLYCGRIARDHFAETFDIDVPAAEQAIERLAVGADIEPVRLALGIIRLGNMRAAATVRRQTLERGNDPRDYTLLASGGAGPLHACEIAREVGIDTVIVPLHPGHYSALGMLSANLRLDRREVLLDSLDDLDLAGVRRKLATMAGELAAELRSDDADAAIEFRYSIAVRFRGQGHALWLAAPESGLDVPDDLPTTLRKEFEAEYLHRYGHVDALSTAETAELELVAERVLPAVTLGLRSRPTTTDRTMAESRWEGSAEALPTPIVARTGLAPGTTMTGPAVLHEVGATTALPPGAVATVLDDGTLSIDVWGTAR